MPNTKTRGGVSVTNAADDGKRPAPIATIKLPVRLRAEHEMALHEELADGALGDTKFSLERTWDGHFWLHVNDTCYVIAWEDLIREVVAAAEA